MILRDIFFALCYNKDKVFDHTDSIGVLYI